MMTDADQKFLTSGQETLKLEIALERFFVADAPEWRARYEAYLKLRLRPAMERLIASGDIEKIEQLVLRGWLDEKLLDWSVRTASDQQQTEILVYLLRRKQELYGFSGQDFSLTTRSIYDDGTDKTITDL